MPVPARVSLVTLGVKDVARSTAFYVALGWPLSSASVPGDVSFFKTAGGLLALWSEDLLAEDAGLPGAAAADRRGHALAINLENREEVDAALATAVAAAGESLELRRRPIGVDTTATSPTWTAISGRLHTTRSGRSATTDDRRCRSSSQSEGDGQDGTS